MGPGYHLTRVDGCPLLKYFVFLVSTRTLENRKSPAVSLGSSRMRYFYFLPAPSPHKPTAPRRDGALEAERGREQGVVFTQLCNVLEVDPRASPCAHACA